MNKMSSLIVGVYGASGFGREVMPITRKSVAVRDSEKTSVVFVDDNPKSQFANGHRIVTYEEFLALKSHKKEMVIAVADGKIRKKISEKLLCNNIPLRNVCADNAVIMDGVEIGVGSVICSFVSITSNTTIGSHFHANFYSYVAHDCEIGDFVTFAPGAKCNGNIIIESYVYIGSGAVIKQGTLTKPLVIGEGAVIGMGAVVTKNVAPGTTVVGNPARPLNKKQ